jgi:hypothetical protein
MKNSKKTYFYEFEQNNPGGRLDVDDILCHRIFIEAESYDEANKIAEDLGIYFDGVEEGMDCECCGDRWCPAYSTIDKPIEEYVRNISIKYPFLDVSGKPESRIFYKSGKVLTFEGGTGNLI